MAGTGLSVCHPVATITVTCIATYVTKLVLDSEGQMVRPGIPLWYPEMRTPVSNHKGVPCPNSPHRKGNGLFLWRGVHAQVLTILPSTPTHISFLPFLTVVGMKPGPQAGQALYCGTTFPSYIPGHFLSKLQGFFNTETL